MESTDPSRSPSLGALIALARDESAPTAERHRAFEEVVRRCADLVFGCAFARLRDHALAEDAAQDTFLAAWRLLDRLREPAAFPGWIRRLVLTQCHRRLRGTRLPLRCEEEARQLADPADPALDAERAADAALVRLALTRLAPADRLVLVLSYGCERSHAEIAEWLGVPVTTVARRLAHAKRRLRRQVLDAISGSLRGRRGTTEAFLVELAARIRVAAPEDAAGIAGLADGLGLQHPAGPSAPAPACAYLVEDPDSRAPIAYAAVTPTIFRPIYALHLAIGEDALRRHAGDVLLTQVVADMTARDAITLQHAVSATHVAVVDFLLARGFEVADRAADWRLHADGAAEATAPAWRRGDLAFAGLAVLDHDAELFASALELLAEAIADEPSQRALLPLHPDTLRRTLRRQSSGVVAIAGGHVVGVIAAATDDVMPGALRLNLVVVRKDARRQGLATAMLARLRATHGGPPLRLVARSSAESTAWLAGRGFTRVADRLLLERLLRKTVAVAPELLAEYVGRYAVAVRPDISIVVERYGDTLVSKSRDMRDVLLASSASEFFTRHHDGHGRFERDESGRVVRLVFRDGPHELVATRC